MLRMMPNSAKSIFCTVKHDEERSNMMKSGKCMKYVCMKQTFMHTCTYLCMHMRAHKTWIPLTPMGSDSFPVTLPSCWEYVT